jgi:hypothetical protein
MKSYKHSGAFGDLIYSLPMVKHFGGGDFYLHLNQIDWIGQHYYGAPPNQFHQGRLTEGDFEFMESFMLAQSYINGFEILNPNTHAITHNLDRFRPVFVGHPTNYIDIYSGVFGLNPDEARICASTPWLTVPEPTKLEGRDIVINRTQRWIPGTPGGQWAEWQTQGYETRAVFVGLEAEYAAFTQTVGWNIPWVTTKNMLELASVIAGATTFIGNQSQCYALAVGLGVPNIRCEARVDMPLARNECYFPNMDNVTYF